MAPVALTETVMAAATARVGRAGTDARSVTGMKVERRAGAVRPQVKSVVTIAAFLPFVVSRAVNPGDDQRSM